MTTEKEGFDRVSVSQSGSALRGAPSGSEPSAPVVAVFLQEREDGGLRVWSDDEPGLILSGRDGNSVSGDIWPAIQALRAHREAAR